MYSSHLGTLASELEVADVTASPAIPSSRAPLVMLSLWSFPVLIRIWVRAEIRHLPFTCSVICKKWFRKSDEHESHLSVCQLQLFKYVSYAVEPNSCH